MQSRLQRPWVFAVFLLAACAALSSQSGTQKGSNTTQPAAAAQQGGETIPVIRSSTRLVMVDVVAQDKRGNPVPDLQATDFKVLEDGKEQKVSIFNFQQSSGSFALQAGTLPPNVFRNTPRFRPN